MKTLHFQLIALMTFVVVNVCTASPRLDTIRKSTPPGYGKGQKLYSFYVFNDMRCGISIIQDNKTIYQDTLKDFQVTSYKLKAGTYVMKSYLLPRYSGKRISQQEIDSVGIYNFAITRTFTVPNDVSKRSLDVLFSSNFEDFCKQRNEEAERKKAEIERKSIEDKRIKDEADRKRIEDQRIKDEVERQKAAEVIRLQKEALQQQIDDAVSKYDLALLYESCGSDRLRKTLEDLINLAPGLIKRCENCAGKKEIIIRQTCDVCGGTSEVDCPYCEFFPDMNPQWLVICKTCNGTGKLGSNQLWTCKQCSGYGYFRCSDCRSTGRIQCPNCRNGIQEKRKCCENCRGMGRLKK